MRPPRYLASNGFQRVSHRGHGRSQASLGHAVDTWEGYPERNVSPSSWLGPGALAVSMTTLRSSCREGQCKAGCWGLRLAEATIQLSPDLEFSDWKWTVSTLGRLELRAWHHWSLFSLATVYLAHSTSRREGPCGARSSYQIHHLLRLWASCQLGCPHPGDRLGPFAICSIQRDLQCLFS